MYIIKNAFRNITRSKGKNILIGVIITVITTCTCIALAIHKAGENLVDTYTKTNPLEVSFELDMQTLRNATDEEKTNFEGLTVESIENYADSSLVKDYYYTLEASVSSTSINPVEDNKRPDNEENQNKEERQPENDKKQMDVGDFRITSYSNFAYLSDFTDGTKKITSGKMVAGSSEENEIVISESLAEENDLEVGDEVTFCLSDDEETTFTYKIIGIYSNSSESDSSSFMSMNALNSANQIYANLTSLNEILEKQGTNDDNTKLVASNGLQAKFYLNDNDKLENFEKEAKEKGLSDYYTATTNESEILETLKPIQNISTFSLNFLIVVLILGIVILTVINILNIRDRKYEIGVLRAIGMSKQKVTLQLVTETLLIALASLLIGAGIGTLCSQPVTNKMLESEIASYQEKIQTSESNFGSGEFSRPSEHLQKGDFKGNDKIKQDNTTTYVDSLKVKIDAITILELFGVSILLTASSACVSSIVINKYNPNKILQNRI